MKLELIEALDVAAAVWFFCCFGGYWLITRSGVFRRRSIMSEVQRLRVLWMRAMLSRENRLGDIHLIGQLSSGHAFFASTSIIVIGGLAALFGAAAEVKQLLEVLPFVAKASLPLWELKLLLLIVLFVIAFFHFAWAFRLAHYTGIMIGSAPYPPSGDEATNGRHARRIARLAGISGEHSNHGLRAFYFAMAAATWILHPALLIVSTTLVAVVLYRREYRSRAFKTIARLAEIGDARR
ncbi:MAG: hypothetical protein RLZ98_3526 [Pseudomonadota bacterium]|jgi:uncharacterized membrane protein